MKFKTEMHCHSCTVSSCGKISPQEIIDKYLEAGYSTVVLTEHFSPNTFASAKYIGTDAWEEKVTHFLTGYQVLKAAAGDKLHILLGVEFRLNKHEAADYLAYGVTESFLRHYPDLMDTGFEKFSNRVRKNGILLYQAHPFRNKMLVTDPELVDGIEVYNGNPKSRNDIAEFWAKYYSVKTISGSDTHRSTDPAVGGILTDAPITSTEELLQVLKSGAYTLLKNGKEEEQI